MTFLLILLFSQPTAIAPCAEVLRTISFSHSKFPFKIQQNPSESSKLYSKRSIRFLFTEGFPSFEILNKQRKNFETELLEVQQQVDQKLSEMNGEKTMAASILRDLLEQKTSLEKIYKQAGLEYRHSLFYFWDPSRILAGIIALHEIDPTLLQATQLRNDHSQATTQILFETLNFKTTGAALHIAAKKRFRSWEIALQMAGIDPHTIYLRGRWNTEKVILGIHALYQVNPFLLNSTQLSKDYSSTTSDILTKVLEFQTHGAKLYEAGYTHFKTWEKALKAAGVGLQAIRFTTRWNAFLVLRGIQVLNKVDPQLLSVSKIKKDKSDTTSQLLKLIGIKATGSRLYKAGMRYFKSWENALLQAGVDPLEVKLVVNWTPEMIQKGLHALYQVNPHLIQTHPLGRDTSESTSRILKQAFGVNTTGRNLYHAGLKEFKTWHDTLTACELPVDSILVRPKAIWHLTSFSHQKECVRTGGCMKKVHICGRLSEEPAQICEHREFSQIMDAFFNSLEAQEAALAFQVVEVIQTAEDSLPEGEELVEWISHKLSPSPNGLTKKVKKVLEKMRNYLPLQSWAP